METLAKLALPFRSKLSTKFSVTYSDLCNQCSAIFTGKQILKEPYRTDQNPDIHHKSVESLLKASAAGCPVCFRVKTGFAVFGGLNPGLETAQGFTRWVLTDVTSETHAREPYRLQIELLNGNACDPETGKRLILEGYEPWEWKVTMLVVPLKDLNAAYKLIIPGDSTASSLCWPQVMEWYNRCCSSHKRCQKTRLDAKWFPTRILDLGQLKKKTLKLCIAAEDSPSGSYLSLSHCWGSLDMIKLTAKTLPEFRKSIPLEELPQTYLDAISIAQRFNIRYLWVDSLCILQDSVDDWHNEAAMMQKVYSNSQLNIMASSSRDGQGGLFRDRNPKHAGLSVIKATWSGQKVENFALLDQTFWISEVTDAPLNQRAWVLQERLMAPRVLHFGQSQLFWECFEVDACETFPERLPSVLSSIYTRMKTVDSEAYNQYVKEAGLTYLRDLKVVGGYKVWNRIVVTYSTCGLTKERDKLTAISALANLMSEIVDDKYLAGLWYKHLPSHLAWHVDKYRQINRQPSYRPTTYRAPTWSWASVEGSISFYTRPNIDVYISVIDAGTTPVTPENPNGEIVDGWIRLQGVLLQVEWDGQSLETWGLRISLNGKTFHTVVYPDGPKWPALETMFLLPLIPTIREDKVEHIDCLLLQSAKGKSRGHYQRFALVTLWMDDADENWKDIVELLRKGVTSSELCLEEDGKSIVLV